MEELLHDLRSGARLSAAPPVLPLIGRRRAALRGELALAKPAFVIPVQRRLMLATAAQLAVEMVGGDDADRAERAARSLFVHRGAEFSAAERAYLAASIAFWSKLTPRVITVSPRAASIAPPAREAA